MPPNIQLNYNKRLCKAKQQVVWGSSARLQGWKWTIVHDRRAVQNSKFPFWCYSRVLLVTSVYCTVEELECVKIFISVDDNSNHLSPFPPNSVVQLFYILIHDLSKSLFGPDLTYSQPMVVYNPYYFLMQL